MISKTGGGGPNPWVWGKNLLFSKICDENCMNMKEIGPRGTPLGPSTDKICFS